MRAGWIWIAAAVLPCAAARADAPNPSFFLVNKADTAIQAVYASPTSNPNWGRDRLGDDTVDPGRWAAIRLVADGTCAFDLRVVFDSGAEEIRRNVNTCRLDNISFGNPRPAAPQSRQDNGRDPSFRVVNRAEQDINELYVRPAGSRSWGRDRLGDDTVDARSSQVIDMPAGQCLWDVRAVFEDGHATERRRVNLCELTDLPLP